MARGFWTGLLHGGVLGAGALLLLSLAAPLPMTEQPEQAPAQEPAGTVPPEAAAPAAGETMPQEQGGPAPAAAALDLPVGSEFARGGDVAPHLPEPLAAPAARLEQTEAPAVTAPAAEPAPVAVLGDARRPEAASADGGPGLAQPDAGESAPMLDQPQAMPAPALQQAPRMAGQGGRDEAPGRLDLPVPATDPAPARPESVEAAAEEPAPSAVVEIRPEPAPPPVAEPAAEADPAPALSAPAPDLSLPPDLTDLRRMERD